ncbi:MAG: SUMF1/EgtB/PvdO family nonheme iron enzyme [Acidobacteriota bacterium]
MRDVPAEGIRVPGTLAIPAGRIEIREAKSAARVVEVAAFLIGRTPVTNAEYAPFLELGGAVEPPWWRDPAFRSPRQPVVGVTWDEAAAFCAWIGRSAGGAWRLPAETEWEIAMSGGLRSPATAWGDSIPPGEIPDGPLDGPWETGLGTPNGFGLLDPGTMVHEWCLDRVEVAEADPAGAPPRPSRRASRGGSWRHRVRWSAPSARSSLPPGYRYSDFGFRVVREMRD